MKENLSLFERAKAFIRAHHRRSVWYRIISVLGVFVVFVTTYMLVLPAITMVKGELICGMEEHVHNSDCYTTKYTFTCGQDEESGHEHTDDCITSLSVLTCQIPEHYHEESCYAQTDDTPDAPAPASAEITPAQAPASDDGELVIDNTPEQEALPELPTEPETTAEETETETETEAEPADTLAWDSTTEPVRFDIRLKLKEGAFAEGSVLDVEYLDEAKAAPYIETLKNQLASAQEGQDADAAVLLPVRATVRDASGNALPTAKAELSIYMEDLAGTISEDTLLFANYDAQGVTWEEEEYDRIPADEAESEHLQADVDAAGVFVLADVQYTERAAETEQPTETVTEQATEAATEQATEAATEKATETANASGAQQNTPSANSWGGFGGAGIEEPGIGDETGRTFVQNADGTLQEAGQPGTETEEAKETNAQTETESGDETDAAETEDESESETENESETEAPAGDFAGGNYMGGDPGLGLEDNGELTQGKKPEQKETENGNETGAQYIYICGLAEHTHTEECYDEEGNLVCGLEEHTHTDECVERPMMGENSSKRANVQIYGEPCDLTSYFKSVLAQRSDNGGYNWNDIKDGEVQLSDWLRFQLSYTLPGHTLEGTNAVQFQLPFKPDASSGEIYSTDGKAVAVGTYTITEEGIVTIIFYEGEDATPGYDYVVQNRSGSPIDGTFYVNTDVQKVIDETSDHKDVVFNEEVHFGFEVQNKYVQGLHVEKKEGSLNIEDGTVSYTITVTSENGTSEDIFLEDVMTNLGLDGDITINPSQDVGQEKTEKGFTLHMPPMTAGSTYTITYTAKLTEELKNGTITGNNKVTVTSKDANGNKLKDEASVDSYFTKDILKKDAVLSDDKSTITWTITVNASKENIAGYTLTDVMFSKILEGVNVNVSPEKGYVWNSEKTQITFEALDDGKNTETYTITYTTPVELNLGEGRITNDAVLHPTSGTDIEARKDVDVYNSWEGGYNPLDKTTDKIIHWNADGKTGVLTWNVKISAEQGDIEAPWFYTDYVSDSANNNETRYHYFTKAQLDALKNILNEQFGAESFEFKAVKIDKTTVSEFEDGVKYVGYRVDFNKSLEKGSTLAWQYNTTVEKNENAPNGQEFSNEAKVNDKVSDNEKVNYKPVVIKSDESINNHSDTNDNTQHSYSELQDGLMKWKIKLFLPQGMNNDVTMDEILPQGVTLQKFEASISDFGEWNKEFNLATKSCEVKFDQDQIVVTATMDENGTIHVAFPAKFVEKYAGHEIIFNIEVKLDETKLPEDGTYSVYKNEVVVKTTEELGRDFQVQEITSKKESTVLSKRSRRRADQDNSPYASEEEKANEERWKKMNIIPYSITVNPDGKDLVPGSETLTLRDELTHYGNADYYMLSTLVPGSVKIYKLNPDGSRTQLYGGENQEPYPFVYEQQGKNYADGEEGKTINILILEVPDATPLEIEYEYQFFPSAGYEQMQAENTATLSGKGYTGSSSQTSVTHKRQTDGGTATTNGVTLYKVDSASYGKLLTGAKFRLSKWNGSSYEIVKDESSGSDRIFETDGTGTVVLSPLDSDVAYKLEEIEAPEGYIFDPAPYYFYMKGNAEEVKKPGDFNGNEYKPGDYLYRQNAKESQQFTLKKVDEESPETALPGAEFELYKFDSSKNEYVATGITYVTNEDGTFVIGIDDDKYSYTYNTAYALKETKAPAGYDLPDNPPLVGYFQFSHLNNDAYPASKPEDFNGVDLSQEAGSYTCTNKKLPNTYIFNKVDSENPDKKLEGAVFAVWEYQNGKYEKLTTYTTDSAGQFTIHWQRDGKGDVEYKKNTAYYVVEESAPNGYDMPSDPEKYYFHFKDTTISDNFYPSDFPEESAVNLFTTDGEMETCINIALPDITVEKQWKSIEGNVVVDPDYPGITAVLKRYKISDEDWKRLPSSVTGETGPQVGGGSATVTLKIASYDPDGAPFINRTETYPVGTQLKIILVYKGSICPEISPSYLCLWSGDGWCTEDNLLKGTIIKISEEEYRYEFTLVVDGDVTVKGKTTTDQNAIESCDIEVASSGDDNSDEKNDLLKPYIDSEFMVERKVLSQDNSWTGSWSNLLKEETIDSTLYHYVYFVEEESVPAGYEATVECTDENGAKKYTIINTATNKKYTSLTVKKEWYGIDGVLNSQTYTPESVKVELYRKSADPGEEDKKVDTQELNSANDWSYSWPDLDEGTYYVKEVDAPEWFKAKYVTEDNEEHDVASDAVAGSGTITIKNTEESTQIEVEKQWSDGNPSHEGDSVTMELYSSTTPPETEAEPKEPEPEPGTGETDPVEPDTDPEQTETDSEKQEPVIENVTINIAIDEWLPSGSVAPSNGWAWVGIFECDQTGDVSNYDDRVNLIYKDGDTTTSNLEPKNEWQRTVSLPGKITTGDNVETKYYRIVIDETPYFDDENKVDYSKDNPLKKLEFRNGNSLVNGDAKTVNISLAATLANETGGTGGTEGSGGDEGAGETTLKITTSRYAPGEILAEKPISNGVAVVKVKYQQQAVTHKERGSFNETNGIKITDEPDQFEDENYLIEVFRIEGLSGKCELEYNVGENFPWGLMLVTIEDPYASIPTPASLSLSTPTMFTSAPGVPINTSLINASPIRPEGATKMEGKDVVLNKENNWYYKWDNLPKTDEDGNTLYYYVVEKDSGKGYTTTYDYQYVDGDKTKGISKVTVTNTPPEKRTTSVGVQKVWQNEKGEPKDAWLDSIQVELLDSGGNQVTGVPVTLNATNSWSYTWSDLPEGTYYVREINTGETVTYTVKYSNSNGTESETPQGAAVTAGTITITNQSTSVSVDKKWVDKNGNELTNLEGKEVKVQLYRVKDGADDEKVGEPVALNGNGESPWYYEWPNLPLGEYYVVEESEEGSEVEGFTALYTNSTESMEEPKPDLNLSEPKNAKVASGTITITNYEDTEIEVEKVWADKKDNHEPITVKLYSSTTPPNTDIVGKNKETASIASTMKLSLGVTDWVDDDKNEAEPTTNGSVWMTVQACDSTGEPLLDENGEAVVYANRLTASNNWHQTTQELPATVTNENGETETKYYLLRFGSENADTQNGIQGLSVLNGPNETNGIVISGDASKDGKLSYNLQATVAGTDTLQPRIDNTRMMMLNSGEGGGDSAETTVDGLDLPEDKKELDEVTLGEGNGLEDHTGKCEGSYVDGNSLKFKWQKLPTVNEKGERIYYYVEESRNDGFKYNTKYTYRYRYDAKEIVVGVEFVTITNTPNKISITAEKVWEWSEPAPANKEEIENSFSVTLTLKKDGDRIAGERTLSVQNNWRVKWEDLDAGHTYTIEEYVTNTSPYAFTPEIAYSWDTTKPLEESGTATVTNVHNPNPYTLPETGGTGTLPYTVGGALLTALATLLLYIQNKRRKEGQGTS